MACKRLLTVALVQVLGTAASGLHGDVVAASKGHIVPLPPRREVLDRHGHAIAHLPPLLRDAACAPDLAAIVIRARHGESGAEIGTQIDTHIDGALQGLALWAVQRGVERLSRVEHQGQPGGVVKVGQMRVGKVIGTSGGGSVDSQIDLDLGVPGVVARLPVPLAPSCPGHVAPALPPPIERFGRGDLLSVRVVSLSPGGKQAVVSLQPQAALVALSPGSRDVLALVGGYGQRPFDFDRATQGRRQAGSTWKPLVFAAALSAHRHSAADMVEDLPRMYGGWRPRNFSGTYQGPMRLRAALAHSVNSVAVSLLSEVGPGRVAQLAERLGIPRAQVPMDLTQALGTALVSPLQLAGAYATFADTLNGRYLAPRILADPGPSSEPAATPASIPASALSPALAYLISSMLGSVISEGSATRARELGIPGLHGKTGTTTQGHDAWFVGYHADLLAVVWVGDDADMADGDRGDSRTGAEAALPIWMDFMRGAQQLAGGKAGPPPLPRPPGLVEVTLPEGGTELSLPDTP